MLVDSDVLIWHLRGLARAMQWLDRLPRRTISTVTYLEVLQGMRDRAEMLALQKSLTRRNTQRLAPTPAISYRAATLMEVWPCLTALEHGLPLLTASIKHFGPIEGLSVERFDPAPEAT